MNFFYYESKLKTVCFFFSFFFFWWVEVGGVGAGVSEFLLQRIQGGIRVGGGSRWTDRRTGPNQFAPSTSTKFGA